MLFSSHLVPLIGLFGSQLVPLVNLCAVATTPLLVWALTEQSLLEATSVRPLGAASTLFTAAAVVLPSLVVGLWAHDYQYPRAAVAVTGLTLAAWVLGARALSSLPAVAFFTLTVSTARAIPGVVYWGFLVFRGDERTWALPLVMMAAGIVAATAYIRRS